MRRIFAVLALLTALVVVPFAGPSNAHTPEASADCHALVVRLTNYDKRDSNNVTVLFGNTTVVDHQTFGSSYTQTISFPDSSVDNQWTVHVRTSADPDGSKGWTKRMTGTSTGCPSSVPTESPTQTTPPQPDPWTEEHSERTVDCDLGVAIVISEAIFHDYEWNPDTQTWDEVVTSSNSHTEQEPLTDKEKAACPKPSTPTPTPTSKPSATPSPHPTSPTPTSTPRPTTEPSPTSPTSIPPSEPSNPSTPPSPQPQPKHVTPPLAETGSDMGVGMALALAGIISVTGALLLWAARRQRNETA